MAVTDFKQIYLQYSPQVYRVCMGYLNDHEKARDMVQETFISVWQNLPTFRNQSALSTWIFRIATNNCLRAVEKAKRAATADLPIDLAAQPGETKQQQLSFLYNCIAQLEEAERIIISLVLEDLPQAEIAAIVGVSPGNIRVKIHRIKEKLSEKFKAHGQFE